MILHQAHVRIQLLQQRRIIKRPASLEVDLAPVLATARKRAAAAGDIRHLVDDLDAERAGEWLGPSAAST